MRPALSTAVLLVLMLVSLTACERLGIADPAKDAAERESEGRAIGSACRQSGRALEDCFTLNQKASKAAIFNGWREMNDYMMQNKIEVVKPEFPVPGLLVSKRKAETDHAPEAESGAASEPAASEPASEAQTAAEKRRARIAEARRRAGQSSAPAKADGKDSGKDKAAAH